MNSIRTPTVQGVETKVPFLSLGSPPGVPQSIGRTWNDEPMITIPINPYNPATVPADIRVDDDGL